MRAPSPGDSASGGLESGPEATAGADDRGDGAAVDRATRGRLLNEREFDVHLGALLEGAGRRGRGGVLVHVGVHEAALVEEYFGARASREIGAQLTELVLRHTRGTDLAAYDVRQHRLRVVIAGADSREVASRLQALSREIAYHTFPTREQPVRLTPTVGVAQLTRGVTVVEMHRRAELAVAYADTRLDLLPVRYERLDSARRRARRRQTSWRVRLRRFAPPFQIAVAVGLPLLVPLLLYAALFAVGLDVTRVAYLVVVVALVLTAAILWTESALALRRLDPPPDPATPYPPASAIIPAYLPNEVATVLDTVEAFLRIDYPAPLQVILAYNTPHPHPIERELEEVAARDPRFVPLHVELSASKAQNVNAALREVTGEFVGIFDADHHPDPDSFRRAWRWLADGWDVVQGRCLIRNGQSSLLARTVAVEFEGLYGVSHPGRARLHDFGIFGGSNGYWRTPLLHNVRMREFMLTEDIDATMRAVDSGARIVSDPCLVSRELSPGSLRGLWNQRMRWAQGWWQVALRHLGPLLRSPRLTPRQKVGMVYLLGWSQIFPWISSQIFPLILFWSVVYGFETLDWLIPVFVMTTLFTIATGPGKTLISYRLADPEIRRHAAWFVGYFFVEALFYTPLKNLITRVAHIKEATGDRQWKVTPRLAAGDSPAEHTPEAA